MDAVKGEIISWIYLCIDVRYMYYVHLTVLYNDTICFYTHHM